MQCLIRLMQRMKPSLLCIVIYHHLAPTTLHAIMLCRLESTSALMALPSFLFTLNNVQSTALAFTVYVEGVLEHKTAWAFSVFRSREITTQYLVQGWSARGNRRQSSVKLQQVNILHENVAGRAPCC